MTPAGTPASSHASASRDTAALSPTTVLGLGLGFCIGAAVAVQGRINGELGARLADGVAAATISFGTGLLALLVAFAVSGRLRAGLGRVRAAVRAGTLPSWQLLGGLCGAFLVASQGLTIAVLGVTAFTVAVIGGQLASSLLVDRAGLAPHGRTPITGLRLVAAVIGISAVLLSSLGATVPGTASAWPLAGAVPPALLIVLPALAGIGLAWQQAVNGRVGAVGGPIAATGVNFTVGLAALLVVEGLILLGTGLPDQFPTEPWLYTGGLLGVAFIAVAALTVRWIGVLLLALSSVAGQLLAAVVLDATGPGVSGPRLISCALVLLAVGVAARPGRPLGRADRTTQTKV